MGMFDEVVTRCPECGEEIEFQTKAGPCLLKRFDAERGVPPEIAVDIQYDAERCIECGTLIELIPTVPLTSIPLRPVIKRD